MQLALGGVAGIGEEWAVLWGEGYMRLGFGRRMGMVL